MPPLHAAPLTRHLGQTLDTTAVPNGTVSDPDQSSESTGSDSSGASDTSVIKFHMSGKTLSNTVATAELAPRLLPSHRGAQLSR